MRSVIAAKVVSDRFQVGLRYSKRSRFVATNAITIKCEVCIIIFLTSYHYTHTTVYDLNDLTINNQPICSDCIEIILTTQYMNDNRFKYAFGESNIICMS